MCWPQAPGPAGSAHGSRAIRAGSLPDRSFVAPAAYRDGEGALSSMGPRLEGVRNPRLVLCHERIWYRSCGIEGNFWRWRRMKNFIDIYPERD